MTSSRGVCCGWRHSNYFWEIKVRPSLSCHTGFRDSRDALCNWRDYYDEAAFRGSRYRCERQKHASDDGGITVESTKFAIDAQGAMAPTKAHSSVNPRIDA